MSETSLNLSSDLLNSGHGVVTNPEAQRTIQKISAYVGRRLLGEYEEGEYRQDRPTAIHEYRDSASIVAGEDFIVIPGVGSHCGPTAAQLLKHKVRPTISLGYFDISPQGTTQQEITQKLETRAQAIKTTLLHGYGHSWGLMRLLIAARNAGIELGGVLGDGAPSSRKTIRYYPAINALVPLLNLLGYDGGDLGKFTITLFKQVERYGISPFDERLAAAKKDTKTGAHPCRHISEIREVQKGGAAQPLHHWRDFIGVVTSRTHIGYAHAEDSTRDRSVHILRARDELAEFCDKLGAHFTDIPVPDSNHANTDKSIEQAEKVGWFVDAGLSEVA